MRFVSQLMPIDSFQIVKVWLALGVACFPVMPGFGEEIDLRKNWKHFQVVARSELSSAGWRCSSCEGNTALDFELARDMEVGSGLVAPADTEIEACLLDIKKGRLVYSTDRYETANGLQFTDHREDLHPGELEICFDHLAVRDEIGGQHEVILGARAKIEGTSISGEKQWQRWKTQTPEGRRYSNLSWFRKHFVKRSDIGQGPATRFAGDAQLRPGWSMNLWTGRTACFRSLGSKLIRLKHCDGLIVRVFKSTERTSCSCPSSRRKTVSPDPPPRPEPANLP